MLPEGSFVIEKLKAATDNFRGGFFFLQNQKRTGVPKRAARLGWWMRRDAATQVEL